MQSLELGRIDHVVNNAGTITISPLVEITTADWDRVIDVNLKGVFLGMKCALPHMLERGSGSIVNVASQAGKRGNRFIAHYNASKAGVISLTQTLRSRRRRGFRQLRVSGRHQHGSPGGGVRGRVPTDGKSRDVIKAEWTESDAAGRFQEVEDVADAVLFLASDDARQTTGEALNVSGGMVME